MKFLPALFVAIWQFQLGQSSFDAAIDAGNTVVIVTAVYPCEGADPISYSEIELKDDGNEKWVEFTFQTDIPIDTTFKANMIVDQWKNGAWEENIYNTDGILCEMRDKFAPKAWKKLTEATEPETDVEECNVLPDTYTSKKFQVEAGDMNIPSMLFGTFRVRFEAYTGEDELFFCTMLEAECSKK